MRFSYVDPSGRKVEIPTLEGLAARFELGAITGDTPLYDAVADRWAPARDHEVFRSLLRDSGQEGGHSSDPASGRGVPGEGPEGDAVAPAPPEVEARAEGSGEDHRPGSPEGAHGSPTAEPAAPPRATFQEPRAGSTGPDRVLFDLSGRSSGPPDERPPERPQGDDFFGAGLDLSLVPEGTGLGHRLPGGELPPLRREGMAGEFSLDDLGPEEVPDAPPPRHRGPDETVSQAFRRGEIDRSPTRSRPPPVEGDRGWRTVPGESVVTPPFHEAEAEGTAYWKSGRTPAARPSRPPPPSPAHPRPGGPPSRKGWARGGAAVVLAAVVFAWFILGRGPASDQGPGTLSPALEEVLNLGTGPAFEGMLSDMESVVATRNLPPGPGPRWLEGAYLAGASRFGAEREYWDGIRSLVEALRTEEGDLFAARLRTEVASIGVSGADAERVVEEGMRRFAATRGLRQGVYDRAHGVAVAAIELHDLLVEHEDEILYEPFTLPGVTRDPILEAVPSNPPLAESMWALIERVTRGLQDMDALMGVSTQGFTEGLFRNLREVSMMTGSARGATPSREDAILVAGFLQSLSAVAVEIVGHAEAVFRAAPEPVHTPRPLPAAEHRG